MPEDASGEGDEPSDEREKQVDGAGDDTTLASVVRGDVDWARCGRFTLVGAFFLAPSLHYWYGFLARILPNNTLRDVASRVVLDQVLFAPIFLGAFLSTIMLVDGKAAKVTRESTESNTFFFFLQPTENPVDSLSVSLYMWGSLP